MLVLMFHNNCLIRFIQLYHAVSNTNAFLNLCIRLQNVLEDFRDMDATALEETKATVRLNSPSVTHRSIGLIISSLSLELKCFESDYFKAICLALKYCLFFSQLLLMNMLLLLSNSSEFFS